MKPLVVDLCAGSGGWAAGFLAEGYRVIGFDIEYQPEYPGELVIADVRKIALGGAAFRHAACIVASPPCQEFSRHDQPWTRAKNPPPPDLSIVEACRRIGADAGVPFVLENVRGAQKFIGPARWRSGSFFLWHDVPAIMPRIEHRQKQNMSSTARLQRARVPFELSAYIARCFRP